MMMSSSTLKSQDHSLGSNFGGIKIPIIQLFYTEKKELTVTETSKPNIDTKIETKGSVLLVFLTVIEFFV